MLRRISFGLLALFALSATLSAQEPVYGLTPPESVSSPSFVPSDDPVDALTSPPASMGATSMASAALPLEASAPAEFASFSGGLSHGGYADVGPASQMYFQSENPGDVYHGDMGYGSGCSTCGGCKSCGMCGGYCGQCSCCPTIWRVRSSSVYMGRETTDDTQLVFSDVAFAGGLLTNSNTLINAADFDLGWEAGFDISLMQGDGYGGEVEGRVLYLNDFNDREVATGNDVELNNLILFNGFEPVDTLNPRTDPVNISADYLSEFRTVELNYLEFFTPWWIVMVGFRYGNLDEELIIRTADSAAVPLVSRTEYNVDNDMFGFQIGTEYILASNPTGWDIITTLKGGVYYNRVDLRVSSGGDGFTNGQGSDVRGETAWLGEATLQARYHVTCNGTFTFGYSLLSVDGVSLATEQMTTVLNPLSGPDLQVRSNRGTALYHGLNAGVEIRW